MLWKLFSGLAAADGMPVFEHFPKRNIANDRDDDTADYDDCYEDELAELPYDKPFQHPSENVRDLQEAPEVHTSGFFGMGAPMIPSQVSTPKWARPTRRPPALTIEEEEESSGYEEKKKKKSATSYVSMSRPKKQATSYVSQARPRPTEERSSHRKKDASSFVTFSLDAKQQKVRLDLT